MVMRVGVIGAGSIGAWHARVLSKGGDTLAAVCDTDRTRAVAAAAKGAAVFDDPADFFASGLDAVVIATPEALHEDHAIAAAQAGCSMLIEKPVAPDMAAIRRNQAAVEAAGVTAKAAHVERFETGSAGLQAAVAQGICGRVTALFARR